MTPQPSEQPDHDCLMASACGVTGFYCSNATQPAVASPAPLDVERLARAIHSVGKKWYRESGEIEDRHIEGNSDQLAAAVLHRGGAMEWGSDRGDAVSRLRRLIFSEWLWDHSPHWVRRNFGWCWPTLVVYLSREDMGR